MIHTVRIDDTARNGKKILSDLSRYRTGVEFDNPAISGIIPEGYLTVDNFFDNVEKKLINKLNENGHIK